LNGMTKLDVPGPNWMCQIATELQIENSPHFLMSAFSDLFHIERDKNVVLSDQANLHGERALQWTASC